MAERIDVVELRRRIARAGRLTRPVAFRRKSFQIGAQLVSFLQENASGNDHGEANVTDESRRFSQTESHRGTDSQSVPPVVSMWRRLSRLSVRAILVLVLIVGAALGWFLRSAKIQRQAVEVINKVGGVQYDWQWSHGSSATRSGPWAPKWLVEAAGVDFFSNVTVVEITGHETTDLEMRHIGNLTKLEKLRLYDVRASAPELARLRGLSELRMVVMIGPGVTDIALEALRGHTRLESVDFINTGITDAGLKNLEQLTSLQELQIGQNSSVTGTGVVHLRGLTELRKLFLDFMPITDEELVNLKGLKNLEVLYLTKSRVTDAGLENLAWMTRLTQLELSECGISDAGIRRLKGLKSLKALMLLNTKVTAAGVEELKQALPDVVVHR